MKLNILTITLIAMAWFSGFTANADYLLKDDSEIFGTWDVVSESPELDGVKRNLQTVWHFKQNGILLSESKDFRAAQGTFTSKLKYRVENGKILKEIRPGKYEECAVIQKEGNDMIMKCRNLYFFLTKQQ